jgi:hypothetical protein
MGKGGSFRANLRATRAQINNAASSAQTRAFKERQIAKQKRDAEERKLRARKDADAKVKKDVEDVKAGDAAAPASADGPARTEPEA